LVEFAIVTTVFLVLIALLLPSLNHARSISRRSACQNNLKQLGIVFRMYAGENRGEAWPRMHGDEQYGKDQAANCRNGLDDADYFADTRAIFPEYVDDPNVLICPNDAGNSRAGSAATLHIVQDDGSGKCAYTGQITNGDASYMYIGYALDKAEDADGTIDSSAIGLPPGTPCNAQFGFALAGIRTGGVGDKNAANDGALYTALDLSSLPSAAAYHPPGSKSLRRLQEHIERFLLTDIADPLEGMRSRIPACWEIVTPADMSIGVGESIDRAYNFNHELAVGLNVLYMDGHVAVTKYPGKFPANRGAMGVASMFGVQ
jgi:prepilin-type processing-associated H-X9-DG protein